MIKLAASDIDGTLLQSGKKEIDGAVFEQIRRLKKKGVLFAAASGRRRNGLSHRSRGMRTWRCSFPGRIRAI